MKGVFFSNQVKCNCYVWVLRRHAWNKGEVESHGKPPPRLNPIQFLIRSYLLSFILEIISSLSRHLGPRAEGVTVRAPLALFVLACLACAPSATLASVAWRPCMTGYFSLIDEQQRKTGTEKTKITAELKVFFRVSSSY